MTRRSAWLTNFKSIKNFICIDFQRILLLISLVFAVSTIQAQREPLSRELISEGQNYLNGNYHGTLQDGKKYFEKAKLLFFYDKSVLRDANFGLSDYHLMIHDTLKAIRILKRIIGSTCTRRIETNNFSSLHPTKKDDWPRYYATSKLTEVYVDVHKFDLAKRYLKYLDEYCDVTWYCGNGAWGHEEIMKKTQNALYENGYFPELKSKKLADSLEFIKDLSYISHDTARLEPGYGDELFWRIVKQKQEIIPFLINELSNNTPTAVSVPNVGGVYTVADVAYTALQEIVKGIPTFKLLGAKFDEDGCGYCSYWFYLRKDFEHRKKFKSKVRFWYEQNKSHLTWVISDEVLTGDSSAKHPNHGHFEIGDIKTKSK